MPPFGDATAWIDGLVPTTAEVLATYDHPHFGQWAAVTSRARGAGRITTVGTVPSPAFARALLTRLSAGRRDPWQPASAELTVTSAVNRDGERVRFLHNWSWTARTYTVPQAGRDVLSGETFEPGDVLELAAWDVRVLRC